MISNTFYKLPQRFTKPKAWRKDRKGDGVMDLRLKILDNLDGGRLNGS